MVVLSGTASGGVGGAGGAGAGLLLGSIAILFDLNWEEDVVVVVLRGCSGSR